jgi:hypothetical protein
MSSQRSRRAPRTRRPRDVPANQQQWFVFGPLTFDVEHAHRIISDHPRPLSSLPVTEWALAYGLATRPGQPASLIQPGPRFDPGYALTVDLSRPVIIATIRGQDPLPLLIDGCHRLYRAAAERRHTLPAHQLTVAETARIVSGTPAFA